MLKRFSLLLLIMLTGCNQTATINFPIDEKSSTNLSPNKDNSEIKQSGSQNGKKVLDVYIAPENLNINLNSKTQIYGMVKYTDNTTDQDFSWSVDNDLVKIDKDGNINPIKKGKAIITLKSNKDNSKTKSIEINIKSVGKLLVKNTNDKEIRFVEIDSNKKGEFVTVWDESSNEKEIILYVQKFNSDFSPNSQPIKVTNISADYYYNPPQIKVILNENGEYIISHFDKSKLSIYKSEGDKLKKIDILQDENLNNYSIDLSDKYFSIIWQHDSSESTRQIFFKTYSISGDLIIEKVKEPLESGKEDFYNPVVVINKDNIFTFYKMSENDSSQIILKKFDLSGNFLKESRNITANTNFSIKKFELVSNNSNFAIYEDNKKLTLFDYEINKTKIFSFDYETNYPKATEIISNDLIFDESLVLKTDKEVLESLPFKKVKDSNRNLFSYSNCPENIFTIFIENKKKSLYIEKFDKNLESF